MKLTHFALAHSRITFFAAIAVLLAGLAAYLDFPSQEEPALPVRSAAVYAVFPGLPTGQMEQLVAKPIEDKIRSMPELKHVSTRVRTGQVLMTVEIGDQHTELAPIWQRLRARMGDVAPLLPTGVQGPFVDDEYGRVAVASLAVTAPELTPSELRREARRLRDGLFALPGVESVTFHGMPEEALYLEMKGDRLVQSGLSLRSLLAELQQQNIVMAGGDVRLGSLLAPVTPTGDLQSEDELRRLPITLPAGGTVPLGELVSVQRSLVNPPGAVVLHRGERAVVLAIAMKEGMNVISFGEALKAHSSTLISALPAGTRAEFVTFQGEVVANDMAKTKRTFYETLLIVMVVVVGFIGWRAGLIVGATVPLTLLATLLVMQFWGITLNNVTLAAIIISLGLLVDNGIVIVEDILRRLAAGEDRRDACVNAGTSLAVPLLTATLACVAAFLPLMLVKNSTGEYTRNLSWVITISLVSSWVISLMIVPLLGYFLAKVPEGHGESEGDVAYSSPFYLAVRRVVEWVQSHRRLYVSGMVGVLALAVGGSLFVPSAFLAESNRRQLMLHWELPAGSASDATLSSAKTLSTWLQTQGKELLVRDDITFLGDGGPRFVLAIDPPDPVAHAGFTILNLDAKGDMDEAARKLQARLSADFPGLRLRVAKFSFGANEAGTLVYRITGPESEPLRALAERYKEAMLRVPGTIHVRDDWEQDVLRASVVVDQEKARRAGVGSVDVAMTLQSVLGGEAVSAYREDDRVLPILWRADAATRSSPEALPSLLVRGSSGEAVPLGAIATVSWVPEPSVIKRRDLSRCISVTGRNPGLSADSLASMVAKDLEGFTPPAGYDVRLGGEIEESTEANAAISTFLPLAVVLLSGVFVWQFNSFRKLVIILLSVPFCFTGVVAAMWVLGGKFDFMATLGLLALAGIIVSNAVLLLERIDEERAEGRAPREALVLACLKRLRPILMTKLTCILGLVPLYFFGGPLWENLAITISGGLAVGTLITLGLVPALYHWFFLSDKPDSVPSKK